MEKVQRTANKKEREYLFVEKLLQRVKVKILAFFCKQSYNNYKVERNTGVVENRSELRQASDLRWCGNADW